MNNGLYVFFQVCVVTLVSMFTISVWYCTSMQHRWWAFNRRSTRVMNYFTISRNVSTFCLVILLSLRISTIWLKSYPLLLLPYQRIWRSSGEAHVQLTPRLAYTSAFSSKSDSVVYLIALNKRLSNRFWIWCFRVMFTIKVANVAKVANLDALRSCFIVVMSVSNLSTFSTVL